MIFLFTKTTFIIKKTQDRITFPQFQVLCSVVLNRYSYVIYFSGNA